MSDEEEDFLEGKDADINLLIYEEDDESFEDDEELEENELESLLEDQEEEFVAMVEKEHFEGILII
jgi:hypothetical protein